MIGSLQSLSRSPLPAVLTINLKGNRLRSLAGVERLLSLEQLNVQDNQISDPMEMARLTGIPNLKRIWVKRNLFTKTASDYRITTFNLFRKTPGYVEDIVIDESGPGYTERKQLVDRAPEVERQLAQPSIRIAELPVIVQQSEPSKPVVGGPGEVAMNSTRRRKAPRRRIVDLAQDESGSRIPTEDLTAAVIAETPIPDRSTLLPGRTYSAPTPVSTSTPEPDTDESSVQTLVHRSSEQINQEDDYRAKIEALRHEFGSNWLSALGDQNWHSSHIVELTRGQGLGHDSLHRPGHQVIVSGGRTLG